MEKIKKVLNYVLIDGFTGMASGLFPTVILCVIIQQIGTWIGGSIGDTLLVFSKIGTMLTGAGIGVGVAIKYKSSPYVIISAAIAGLIGSFASKILSNQLLVNGNLVLSGAGEPLGAFIAAFAGIQFGNLISGKTKLDILLTPALTIITGGTIGLLVGPSISGFMTFLGSIINWSVEQQPILMGMIVSVIVGGALTMPISSAALAIVLNLSGLAAGAATAGCASNMIGFAIASYKDNKTGGLIAQGIGSSKLQMANVMRKPVIWLPAIISSVLLGPLSTTVFHMSNIASGAGMGNCGFIGPILTWQTMANTENNIILFIKIALLYFILPGLIAWGIGKLLRKKNIIKDGDMKLEL